MSFWWAAGGKALQLTLPYLWPASPTLDEYGGGWWNWSLWRKIVRSGYHRGTLFCSSLFAANNIIPVEKESILFSPRLGVRTLFSLSTNRQCSVGVILYQSGVSATLRPSNWIRSLCPDGGRLGKGLRKNMGDKKRTLMDCFPMHLFLQGYPSFP